MSEQQIQKVRVKRLAHVGFWATDVAAQTRFYRQVLGFNLRATEINSAGQDVTSCFSCADALHQTGVQERLH